MARNLYEVELVNGQLYDVRTDHHHEDHSHDKFKEILVNVLCQIVACVATHHITKIRFKGKG